MSHTPALEKIREQAVRIGAVPHLLTQSADGRPHAVAVEIAWDEDALRLTAGKRSATNVATQRLVSVLWAAAAAGEYSLIIDAEGEVHRSGGQTEIVLKPTRAVLHRPGLPNGPGKTNCGADCVPLLG